MASRGPQNSSVVVSTLRTQLVPGGVGGERKGGRGVQCKCSVRCQQWISVSRGALARWMQLCYLLGKYESCGGPCSPISASPLARLTASPRGPPCSPPMILYSAADT